MVCISPPVTGAGDARACLMSAQAAAAASNIPLDEVLHRSRRSRDAAGARALAMYLAHVGLGLPLTRVANGFGRHRSTVAYACRRIEERREAPMWDRRIDRLEDEVRDCAALAALPLATSQRANAQPATHGEGAR